MSNPNNPTNTYTVPAVSISTARTGASSRANELGMRAMQERTYARRGEQYLHRADTRNLTHSINRIPVP